jgi:hypothetical protein
MLTDFFQDQLESGYMEDWEDIKIVVKRSKSAN